jgi:3-oxoacyl-[acyl-carrier-protein] synthase III
MKSGDEILFAVQGSGLTIGTAPYTLDDLPDRVKNVESRSEPSTSLTRGGGRTRATVKASTPRIRIESLGTAGGIEGPGAGIGLVQAAIARCLGTSSYAPEDVELLIYAGVYRDDFVGEPAIAAMIANGAKLNDAGISPDGKKTLAFDVCNGAVGFLNACCVAAGMIRSGEIKTAMVVASEVENNSGIPGEDLLGIAEVGSAVILDRSPEGTRGFGDAVFMSFTEYRGAFSSELVYSGGRARLHFERHAEIEAIYLRCVVPAVEEILRGAALRMEDVAVILPPQISASFASGLASTLNVSRDKVVAVAGDGRDLSSSALAYSLRHVSERGTLRPGDIGLVINVGSGIQVGVALYYF